MIFGALSEMKRAASAYVDRQDWKTARVSVVEFNSHSRVAIPLSSDPLAIKMAIEALEVDGSTRMDLGLESAVGALPQTPQRALASTGQQTIEARNILLFTDGYPDDQSDDGDNPVARTVEVARSARAGGIKIVAVGTEDADKDYLAQVTGDPALVFGASAGSFGEAFQLAENALTGNKGRAMIQSQAVENYDAAREWTRTGVWAALVGLGASIALIGMQSRTVRRKIGWAEVGGMAAGALAGAVAGLIGQAIFSGVSDGNFVVTLGRLVAWAAGGALLGAGLAPFVPNLQMWRAALGGAGGGWIGAMAFILAARAAGDSAGRVLGATILGFAIGAMVVLAEVAFRTAWLHVSYGPRDAFDVNLGAQPLAVGSDRSRCRIFTREAPPIAARYAFEGGKPTLTDASGQTRPLANGDARRFGNVEITLHLEGAATRANAFGAPLAPMAPPSAAPPIAEPPVTISSRWHLRGEPSFDLPANGALSIGRIAGNDMVIGDAGVSSRHATLQIGFNGLTVTDLGSTNGTWINGGKLAANAPALLKNGDVIQFGRSPFRVEKS